MPVVPKACGEVERVGQAQVGFRERNGVVGYVRRVRAALSDSEQQRRAPREGVEAAELERAAEVRSIDDVLRLGFELATDAE